MDNVSPPPVMETWTDYYSILVMPKEWMDNIRIYHECEDSRGSKFGITRFAE